MLGWSRRSLTPGTVGLAGAESLHVPKPAMSDKANAATIDGASAGRPEPARHRVAGAAKIAIERKVKPWRPTSEATWANVRLAPRVIPMSSHGNPVNSNPRAHSLTPSPKARAKMRMGPDDQRSRARANPKAVNSARPAGKARTASGNAQANLSASTRTAE